MSRMSVTEKPYGRAAKATAESTVKRFLSFALLVVIPALLGAFGLVVGGANGDMAAGLVAGLGLGITISALLFPLFRRNLAKKTPAVSVVRTGPPDEPGR